MEIVFYDVETTVPERKGEAFEILEFGAVVVSAKLEELDSFSTLVRPSSLSLITKRSTACNGIQAGSLEDVPAFLDIADRVYALLNGRVWGGHNILRFDNLRIKEAFARVDRPVPQAAGYIDTLPLLRSKFGSRAGNLKMATLAAYFGLGKQEHRSLADVRMNIEVLKLCSTVMFLEQNFPEIYVRTEDQQLVSPVSSRRRSSSSGSTVVSERPSCTDEMTMGSIAIALEEVAATIGAREEEKEEGDPPREEEEEVKEEGQNGYLRPRDVLLNLVRVKPEGHQLVLMHGSRPLRMRERNARVKFSVSNKFAFTDNGKPTFSIVIVPSKVVIDLVRECEALAKKVIGLDAQWRPVLVQEEAVRIKVGTAGQGASARYTTRLCNGECEGAAVELEAFQKLVPVGSTVDVDFSCLAYSLPGSYAGLQLLADHISVTSQV